MALAAGEVPVPLARRLFLAARWTSDPARLDHAGVPTAWQAERSNPVTASAEIVRAPAAGVRFGRVPADAGYGLVHHSGKGFSEGRLQGGCVEPLASSGTRRSTRTTSD